METEATGNTSPLFLREYLGEVRLKSLRYGLVDSEYTSFWKVDILVSNTNSGPWIPDSNFVSVT